MNINSKLPAIGTTIFTVMSKLANEHKAINLSQGFPDFDCSPKLINLVDKHMKRGMNQYAPMAGILTLRERISEKQYSLHQALYDPNAEVTITAGGTQAIFTTLAAMIHPGDEVIVFEPAYDSYIPTIQLLGGIVKSLELSPPNYKIDWEEVRKLITPRTRMIILNSPNNPTGTILEQEDIDKLIEICRDTDILILSDEVYEHLVYDGRKHLSISAYSELRERSFICASFGKLFHTTGWKVGYCLAPSSLMNEFRKVHQFLVFSVNTPMQYAISEFMENKANYLELSSFFQEKRDYFRNLMRQTRFDLLPCAGSYFQSVQYSRISEEADTVFSKKLTQEYGVASIPVSAFYQNHTDHHVLRFCFAKEQETLRKAVDNLGSI